MNHVNTGSHFAINFFFPLSVSFFSFFLSLLFPSSSSSFFRVLSREKVRDMHVSRGSGSGGGGGGVGGCEGMESPEVAVKESARGEKRERGTTSAAENGEGNDNGVEEELARGGRRREKPGAL